MTGAAAKPPLAGKRIAVTRARGQASSLVAALTKLGAEVIELPTIEIVPLEFYDLLDAALRNVSRYDWLIVTSANTVRVLIKRLAALRLPISVLAAPQKAAIGAATARTMREQGIEVDVVPERYVAESLVIAMGERVSGSRILLARAAIARDLIPDELTRIGAKVDVVDAYRTVIPSGAVDRVRQVFSDVVRPPDAITFTSSSTVKNFLALWKEAGLGGVPQDLREISIGPVTSATLHEHGWKETAEGKTYDVAGLIEMIVEEFSH